MHKRKSQRVTVLTISFLTILIFHRVRISVVCIYLLRQNVTQMRKNIVLVLCLHFCLDFNVSVN